MDVRTNDGANDCVLQMKGRRGYEEFGFANIEDHALELLGF